MSNVLALTPGKVGAVTLQRSQEDIPLGLLAPRAHMQLFYTHTKNRQPFDGFITVNSFLLSGNCYG